MDVDSAYFDISGECLRDVLKPELLEEFDKEVKNWLETDNIILDRTPALFKPEFIGAKMDKAKNVGFRGYDQVITTYQQSNLRSSDYYDKRYMLTDGVHTMPLEF